MIDQKNLQKTERKEKTLTEKLPDYKKLYSECMQ